MDFSQLEIGDLTEISSGRTMLQSDWRQRIEDRCAELVRGGLKEREAVVLARSNTIEFFIDLFAIWRAKGVAVPIDPSLPEAALQPWMKVLKPRWVVGDKWSVVVDAPVLRHPESSALVLLTSGSTGRAKAVLHSFAAIERKMNLLQLQIGDAALRSFCALPAFFGHGLICNALFPLLNGGHLFLADGFKPALVGELADLIDQHQISFFSTTPVVWGLIESLSGRRPLPGLKRVHCASAFLDDAKATFMRDWCVGAEVWNVYGLTETLGWIGGTNLLDVGEPGDVGGLWDAEAQVDSGERLSVRSPYQAIGVLTLGSGDSKPDADWLKIKSDAWIDTGDRARISLEGRVVLLGRHDFVINKGGLKVQPEEVEAAVALDPEVVDSCCYAINDSLWGQKIGLAVVVRSPEKFRIDQFLAGMSTQLAHYKVPDHVRVVPVLERNARGKIDRASIQKLFGRDE